MELLGDGCNYSSIPSLCDPIQVGVVMEVEVVEVVEGGGGVEFQQWKNLQVL